MSASAASSMCAAMRLPFSMIWSAALIITIEARRMDRPACEPPPSFTTSVSPSMNRTESIGTPSHSTTTWAKLVSWPWPDDCVPTTSPTEPSGPTSISARSRGAPDEDSR